MPATTIDPHRAAGETPAATHLSRVLRLAIGGIADGDARVTPPRVDQEGFDVDLGQFDGDARVVVDAWPLMASGQTWRLIAKPSAGSDLVLGNGTVQSTGSFERPLQRDWLEGLPDGGTFSLMLIIAFNGELERTFQSPAYTVISQRNREDFESYPEQIIPPATSVELKTMRIAVGSPDTRIVAQPMLSPDFGGNVLSIKEDGSLGICGLHFLKPWTRVTFWYVASSADMSIDAYRLNGSIIWTYTPIAGQLSQLVIDQSVAFYLEIRIGDSGSILLDSFEMS